jgi:hypothetical protein
VDAVDQQRHQIERIQSGRSPGRELGRGLRHKSTTHSTFAGAADADLDARWFQAATVLPRGDPEEHLLDHATIQRIGVGERLKRGPPARTRGRRLWTFCPPRTTSLDTVPARDVARAA